MKFSVDRCLVNYRFLSNTLHNGERGDKGCSGRARIDVRPLVSVSTLILKDVRTTAFSNLVTLIRHMGKLY